MSSKSPHPLRKPLALALALVMIALVLPAISVTVHAANVVIDAADLNSGVASNTNYNAGDTVIIIGAPGNQLTLAGWESLRTLATPMNLVLDDTITSIPGDPIGRYLPVYTAVLSVQGNGVREIGDNAFSDFTGLTAAYFPNATHVGKWAFWGCSLITSISLPQVTDIGISAFYSCTSLTSIYLSGTCPNIDASAFQGVPNGLTILVSNPGDASYDSLPLIFPAGSVVKKHIVPNSGGPATPPGVGGGLVDPNAPADKDKEEVQASLGTATVTARRLNVRPTSDTTLRPLGRLARGTVVEVLAIENNFAQIQYTGKTAYVSLDYLKLDFEIVR